MPFKNDLATERIGAELCDRSAALGAQRLWLAALVDAQQAAELLPGYAKAAQRCGAANAQLGRYAEAAEDYKRAVSLLSAAGTSYSKSDVMAVGEQQEEMGKKKESLSTNRISSFLEKISLRIESNRDSVKYEPLKLNA